MNKIIIIAITLITLLAGCRTDGEYDIVVQEKAKLAKELAEATKKLNDFESGEAAIANRIARRKLEIVDEENRLEIALTCNYLWFDICPPVISSLDFEAYQKAGIQASYTWRSWVIFIVGISIWVAVFWLTFLTAAQAYRMSKEPRNREVIAAREIIAEAEKQRLLVLGGFLDEKIKLQLELGNLRLQNQKTAAELPKIEGRIRQLESDLIGLEIEKEERELELKELQEEIDMKNKLFGR